MYSRVACKFESAIVSVSAQDTYWLLIRAEKRVYELVNCASRNVDSFFDFFELVKFKMERSFDSHYTTASDALVSFGH